MTEKVLCYGFAIAVEGIIAWRYFSRLFTCKRKPVVLWPAFLTGYLFLFVISFAGSMIANEIAFWLVNFSLLWFGYSTKVKPAFFHAAYLSFSMSIAELVADLAVTSFGYSFVAYTRNIFVLIVMGASSKLLYLSFAVIGIRLFRSAGQSNETPPLMILFCSLPMFSTILTILSAYIASAHTMTEATAIVLAIFSAALLVVNLVILILYDHLAAINAQYLSLQLQRQKEDADLAYYSALQQQTEEQRILVHDIKNHLQILHNMAQEAQTPQIVAYITQLHEKMASTRRAKLCVDPILNAILLNTQNICQEKEITFWHDVRDSHLRFMDPPSITALFGNLLSNAVEAAACSAEKYIDVSVRWQTEQDFIIICVENACDIAPTTDSQGFFKTRKPDKQLHGVGMRSIRQVVDAYGGISTTKYDEDEHVFRHIIQLPCHVRETEKAVADSI